MCSPSLEKITEDLREGGGVEVGGLGRIFAAPPHRNIWETVRRGLMKLGGGGGEE